MYLVLSKIKYGMLLVVVLVLEQLEEEEEEQQGQHLFVADPNQNPLGKKDPLKVVPQHGLSEVNLVKEDCLWLLLLLSCVFIVTRS